MLSGNAMGAGFGFVLQRAGSASFSLQECILRKRFTLLRSYLVAFVIEWSARISLISTLAMSSVVSIAIIVLGGWTTVYLLFMKKS